MTVPAAVDVGSFVIALLVALGAASIIGRTLRNGVPPMPSSARVRACMTALLLRAELPVGSTVVELGSGWGGLSRAVGRALENATVIGYENSRVPYWFARAANRLERVRNLRLLRSDFHMASLRDADLVICYLSPDAMTRLQPKLDAELKPSAIVMSSTFALPGWKPTRVAVAEDIYRTPVYLYHAGACRTADVGRHIDILEAEGNLETNDGTFA